MKVAVLLSNGDSPTCPHCGNHNAILYGQCRDCDSSAPITFSLKGFSNSTFRAVQEDKILVQKWTESGWKDFTRTNKNDLYKEAVPCT